MSQLKDLTGQRFGRLTVVERAESRRHGNQLKTFWLCRCDCGNTKEISATNLQTGCSQSCGCIANEARISSGHKNRKHGGFGTRLYRIYRGMWQRCYDSNDPHFVNYGSRGINICNEWVGEHGFENFRDWSLKNGYSDNLSIDRIDNSLGYSPLNCRWATVKEQQNNRRTNVFLTLNGEMHTMAEWAEITGINVATIKSRHKAGWDDEKILKTPVRHFTNFHGRLNIR